jgi:septal ring-binding cell division protein DamX
VEVTPIEKRPMEKVRPVERVTMYEAGAAAMEDGRCTKTAVVDRHPTAPEPTAVKGRAATAEAAAMKCRSAAAEAAAMETAATAVEATTATAAKTAAAHPTAVLNLGRQSVGCKFRGRRGAGTRKRKRLGALV